MSQSHHTQQRKDRYASDPEFRQRCLEAGKRYHAKKRATDPEYREKRAAYNKQHYVHLTQKSKEHNQTHPFKYAARRIKERARRDGIVCDIDETYLQEIWTGACAILGIPLALPYSTERQADNKATVDRIVPNLGYVQGNVSWVSNRANIIKSFGSLEEHQMIVEYIQTRTVKRST
jgi:hypothetical protein